MEKGKGAVQRWGARKKYWRFIRRERELRNGIRKDRRIGEKERERIVREARIEEQDEMGRKH